MANTWLQDNIDSLGGSSPTRTSAPAPVSQPPTPSYSSPTPPPVKAPSYNPIQTFQSNVNTAKNYATAGLGKIADYLSRPLQFVGAGGKAGEQARQQGQNYFGQMKAAYQGGWRGLTGQDTTTPGSYVSNDVLKLKNPYAKAGVQLATDLVADPLNVLGFLDKAKSVKTVMGGTEKIAEALKGTKAADLASKAVDFAKKTPQIYKPIEATINPYFRNPEAGKIIEATKEAIRSRTAQLYRYVDEAQQGLTGAEKARIGQLLEGGISNTKNVGLIKTVYQTDPKLVEIANQFRKMGEDIGAESVKTGLLSPEAFQQLKGNYMHHMWDVVTKPDIAKNFGYTASDLPTIINDTFKKRTGAEGFVRQFQAPTFKGLGTEIRSNEAAKMYQSLGKQFGVSAEPTISSTDLSKELLNTLLKNKPKIRPGLGEISKPGFTTSENIGSELLKTFQDYQPAKGLSKGIATDVTGGINRTRRVLNPNDSKLFAQTIWGNPEAQRAYASAMRDIGITPTESNLKVFLEKVGTLPEQKATQSLLSTEKAKRIIQEGYKYAPQELTNARGAGVLKDTALPQEVIDYLKRYQGTARTEAGKIYDAGMNLWKQGKTVWNPAYHVRNILSNQILTELQTGKGLPRTLLDYADSVKRYLGKGEQKYVTEARDVGLIKNPNFAQGVQDLLGNSFQKEGLLKRLTKKPNELQTFMEETAKLNVFSEMRRRGKSVDEAMKLAEEAIFSPYRISQAERSTIGRAIPFYSFTRQAAPFIGKQLVTHPERFTKYIKAERASETAAGNPDKTNLPAYMQGMVAIPAKNKEGQQKFFNPQYIYPWGNFLPEANSSTGLKLPFGLSEPPALTEYAAQKTGVDPYYGTPFVTQAMPKSQQIKARIGHLATTIAPSLASAAVNKILPALQGHSDKQGRQRSIPDVLLGELAGLKSYPFDASKATKSNSTNIYYIQKDAQSLINKIRKDQSLTPQEKQKQIREVQLRMQERLQGK